MPRKSVENARAGEDRSFTPSRSDRSNLFNSIRSLREIVSKYRIYPRPNNYIKRVGKIGERLFTREEGSGSKESITGVGNRKGVRLAAKLFRSPTRLRNNRAPTETFRAKLVDFFSPPFFLKVRNGENISSIAGRSE